MSTQLIDTTVTATWGPDQPLSVLADLVEKRMRILNETSQQAVVATGITCIQSLRAQTKVAPKNQRPAERVFERVRDKAPYLTVRGRGTGLLRRWRYTFLPGTSSERTYIVYPYTERKRVKGKMHGGNETAEKNEILAQFGKRPIKHRGLAKTALGIAMSNLAQSTGREASAKVSQLAAANVSTKWSINGNTFELVVHDALEYAMLALKNGKATFDQAYKSAANKIAGRLQHVINKVGTDFWGDVNIGTPFPEVAQKRRSA